MFPIVTANNKNETELRHDATCAVICAMKQREDELINQKETQFKKACTDLFFPDLFPLCFPVSAEELEKEQRTDSSLDVIFQCAITPAEMGNLTRGYLVSDGVLLRKWIPPKGDFVWDPVFQVVVPVKFPRTMIEIAHDQSGHQGVRKNYDHLLRYYFWPRLKRNISIYINKCKTCQLTSKLNQVLKPAPLKQIQAAGEPFEHLLVDCVRPLPRSKSGCNYLFTVMCLNTRFPEAYPLRSITSHYIVRALTSFISIYIGSNLTPHLFQPVLKQLHTKHNQSTVYHAQSQGALERFHQSLKSLLRTYCV